MNLRACCQFAFSVLLVLGTVANYAQRANGQESQPAVLQVLITDQDSHPIDEADVELRHWTGDWIPTGFKGKSDSKGEIEFKGIRPDVYSTVLVRHPDFASIMQDFTVTPGEQRSVTCKLLPRVEGWIEVRSPDGELVSGAEISRMEVVSVDSETKTFLSCDMFPMMTGRPKSEFRSDASGRLKLPPVPAGSSVKLTIVHPNWAAGESPEMETRAGMVSTVVLNKGTQVEINFHGNKQALDELRGQEIAIHTHSRDVPKGRLIHKFVNDDDKIKFSLLPGQYEAFYLRADGFVITPQIPSSPWHSDYNKFETDHAKKSSVVRKLREIRGRVVTDQGKPVAGTTMIVSSENLALDQEGKLVRLKSFPWCSCSFPQTDADGYYVAKVPDGPVQIDAQWSEYYAEIDQLEFNSDGASPIPDFVVRPFPHLQGIVIDAQQQPVSKAVVRVLSQSETKYVLSDENGNFSFELERFEFDPVAKKRTFDAKLLAFNPHNNQAQLITVDARDAAAFSNIKIELKPRSLDWIPESLTRWRKPFMAAYPPAVKSDMEKELAKMRLDFPEGHPGNLAPELDGGTWFNTEATSLKDLRGQFVLLDFWFIGCGPCERDFPSLKLAQELYGEQGFTVLSVHIAGQTPGNVKQYADGRELTFPLVVDNPSGDILAAYEKLGVKSFPSYLLIGPDGKIIRNDQTWDPDDKNALGLRVDKLEAIHRAMNSQSTQQRTP